MRSRGFSLIELLVVVSIIAVLAGLMLPAIGQIRDLANRLACAAKMRQVALAVTAYRGEQEGLIPPQSLSTAQDAWSGAPTGGGRWFQLLEPYVDTYDQFNCPVAARLRGDFAVHDRAGASWSRGTAMNWSNVCGMAINGRVWGRFPNTPGQPWLPAAPYGPMTLGAVQGYLAAAGSDIDRCPLLFDGVWRNGSNDLQTNHWGCFFPHRERSNTAFIDGRIEVHAVGDYADFNLAALR